MALSVGKNPLSCSNGWLGTTTARLVIPGRARLVSREDEVADFLGVYAVKFEFAAFVFNTTVTRLRIRRQWPNL